MQQPASIFNDVIGPVMIGPSSSHTAASVRIGRLIRQMTNGDPKKVLFEFSQSGVIAYTYHGQGSDFGLSGGLLGYEANDKRIVPSLKEAADKGIDISFSVVEEDFAAVSLYRIKAEGGGRAIETEIDSLGGGMIEITRFNGIPVSVGGGFYEAFLLLGKLDSPAANKLLSEIVARMPKTAAAVLCESDEGNRLINVKSEFSLNPSLWKGIPILDSILLSPVLPIPSRIHYPELFETAAEIEKIAKKNPELTLSDIAIMYESARGGIAEEQVLDKAVQIIKTLLHTIDRVTKQEKEYPDRILPRQAHKLENAVQVPGDAFNAATKCITLLMEAKSSMEVIVAAPTGGSCGAVPGTLIGVGKTLGRTDEEIARALLAAGIIGVLIAARSTFNAEIGGCQAECGAGSCMAAAGLVHLMGGSVAQALDASSMALQNVIGMTCDPVADRVEVPCLGKNIMAGMNAIAMANLALAGFDKVIPLDETIGAADQACRMIPIELRTVGKAGLSTTETSKRIWRRLNDC